MSGFASPRRFENLQEMPTILPGYQALSEAGVQRDDEEDEEGGGDEVLYSPSRPGAHNSWLPTPLQIPEVTIPLSYVTAVVGHGRSTLGLDVSPPVGGSPRVGGGAGGLSSGGPSGRLVDRDGDFHQSRGRLAIRKKIRRSDWRALYAYDLFHSLVDAPTSRTILLLFALYISIIFTFSWLYYLASSLFPMCDMGLDSFTHAFYFSLETTATIGYGTRDIFFGGCWTPAFLLTAHMCVRLVSDSLTLGVIYSRLARPTTRASTVLFSDHAVVRRVRGRLYLMFQLCELRKHQLNEAHVRLYVVRRERAPAPTSSSGQAAAGGGGGGGGGRYQGAQSSPAGAPDPAGVTFFQTCAMRLSHPNDELGGMLLLCLPQLVVHELDDSSPLVPPLSWRLPTGSEEEGEEEGDGEGEGDEGGGCSASAPASPSPSASASAFGAGGEGGQDGGEVPLFPGAAGRGVYHRRRPPSSQPSPSLSPLPSPQNNPKRQQGAKDGLQEGQEEGEEGQEEGEEGQEEGEEEKEETPAQAAQRVRIQAYLRLSRAEVVAVVEGMDAATGGVVQARHSFIEQEIQWHKTFAPCVFEDPAENGVALVDFAKFHKLLPAPVDARTAGAVSSQI